MHFDKGLFVFILGHILILIQVLVSHIQHLGGRRIEQDAVSIRVRRVLVSLSDRG